MKMRVDIKKIKPFGAVLILVLSVVGIFMIYTTDLGIPARYESLHEPEYYAQSALTLEELHEELRVNVFPNLDGITDSYVDAAKNRLVIHVARKSHDRVKAVLARDFSESLFEFVVI